MQTERLSHPAVEIQLPLDGNSHQYVIPSDTTLFFWRALTPGTEARLAPLDSRRGSRQQSLESNLRDRVSWSVSLDGEPIHFMTELYRDSGYRGLGWWSVTDAVELPAVLTIEFETTGEPPTIDGNPIVCWTDDGQNIPWNRRVASTVHLRSPTNPSREFETAREALWNRHDVYQPVQEQA